MVKYDETLRRRKIQSSVGCIYSSYGWLPASVVDNLFLEKGFARARDLGFIVDDYYVEIRCPICGQLLTTEDRRCPFCKTRIAIKPLFINILKDPHFHLVTYDTEIKYIKCVHVFVGLSKKTKVWAVHTLKKDFEEHPEKYPPKYGEMWRQYINMDRFYIRTFYDANLAAETMLRSPYLTEQDKKVIHAGLGIAELLPISYSNRHYKHPDECMYLTDLQISKFFYSRGNSVTAHTTLNIRRNNIWKEVVNMD